MRVAPHSLWGFHARVVSIGHGHILHTQVQVNSMHANWYVVNLISLTRDDSRRRKNALSLTSQSRDGVRESRRAPSAEHRARRRATATRETRTVRRTREATARGEAYRLSYVPLNRKHYTNVAVPVPTPARAVPEVISPEPEPRLW